MTGASELMEKKTEETQPLISLQEIQEMQAEKKVDWDELLKYLQIQKEAFKKLRIIMLGYTRDNDFKNIDGSPYLEESGAQAIAGPMGVSIVNVSKEKEWRDDKKGRYYIWCYKGTAYSTKICRIFEAEGICTSRDMFFGKISGVYKELEEVDERRIMEKARTNLYRNAIIRVLGIRNIQWAELSEAGLDIRRIEKVEHSVHGRKTGASEKAIQDQEEREKKGEKAGGYSAVIVKKTADMTSHISTASSMEKLKEIWEKDRKDRESLPKELFEGIVKEKDARKAWLLQRETKKDDL